MTNRSHFFSSVFPICHKSVCLHVINELARAAPYMSHVILLMFLCSSPLETIWIFFFQDFKMSLLIIYLSFCLFSTAHAVMLGGPAPTSPSQQMTPSPSHPLPSSIEQRDHTIEAASAKISIKQTVTHPSVCGWDMGVMTKQIACEKDKTCIHYHDYGLHLIGCCGKDKKRECGWASRCIDSTALTDPSVCDFKCHQQKLVKQCSDKNSPKCFTWYHGELAAMTFGCTTEMETTSVEVWQTGTDSTAVMTVALYELSGELPGISPGGSLTFVPGPTRSSIIQSTPATDTQTGLPVPPQTSSKDPQKNVAHHLLPGTIVAIVLGSLAFILGALAVFTFFWLREKKPQSTPSTPSPNHNASLSPDQITHLHSQSYSISSTPRSAASYPPPRPPRTPPPPPLPYRSSAGNSTQYHRDVSWPSDRGIYTHHSMSPAKSDCRDGFSSAAFTTMSGTVTSSRVGSEDMEERALVEEVKKGGWMFRSGKGR
ncbi:hypothetical protein B0J11DRAFT_128521 [Dendryphion nanum]|uniref:Uncharacterized protein n=1 Tax=Dendryphion nanum TaxID=256645 RepID=A0A9P9D7Q1_9PLEO|nr:hypothetical protein B0J11DRAFT_128521 [Dendryphion nanum]